VLPEKIILAGFMGTGKTSVGKALAKKLGYPFIDTDQWVEGQVGRSILEIFESEGESAFRQWERKAINQALAYPKAVIAVGGGAVMAPENLRKLLSGGSLFLLEASVPTLLKRLAKEKHRPLLQGKADQVKTKMQRLLKERAEVYGRIDLKVSTEGRSIEEISEAILSHFEDSPCELRVQLNQNPYPIFFQKDKPDQLKHLIKENCSSEQVVLISNTTVFLKHGKRWTQSLKQDFQVHTVILPDGEQFKTFKTIGRIYHDLVRLKVDRRTPLIALGGGVIGDLVGFAAATYLRGVPLVQIPTTLLAQVDSSIGGKTGFDLPQGKNLVGAFYQPDFVLIDENFLSTLSPRQLRCGMAEVIKYAAIFDLELFEELESKVETFLKNKGAGLQTIVRRCCELKAMVVEKDERDLSGLRAKLNFGHTLGHAIESLTHYKKYTHGEAISIGMGFAGRLSQKKTGFKENDLKRLKALLEKAGLPLQIPSFSKAQYKNALIQDKKRVSSQIHFVYLKKLGESVVIETPFDEITRAL